MLPKRRITFVAKDVRRMIQEADRLRSELHGFALLDYYVTNVTYES